jgi:ATP-dependent protease Clp ATPase subunit
MLKKLLYCTFCNKSQNEVEALFAGAEANICNECVELCGQIIAQKRDDVAAAKIGQPSAWVVGDDALHHHFS